MKNISVVTVNVSQKGKNNKRKSRRKVMKNIAVVFAGGIGKRMQTKALPKQFLRLHNKPIIIHTLEKFQTCDKVDGIIVVMVENYIDYFKDLLKEFSHITKVGAIVEGGKNCQQSIYNGLIAAQNTYGEDCIVLIHDGVRPIIDSDLIERNIKTTLEYGNAISAAKVVETVFLTDNGKVGEVVDRSKCWLAKAPQTFKLKDILYAHQKAIEIGKFDYIDSCSIMQSIGVELCIVECCNDNIKITTPTDYYLFKAIIEKYENKQIM